MGLTPAGPPRRRLDTLRAVLRETPHADAVRLALGGVPAVPRLYVGRPEHGDGLPYAGSLRVEGWACADDLERVEVSRSGDEPAAAVLVAPSDELVASVGALARVFFLVLDVRAWTPGEHLVVIRAVTAAGRTATIVRRVVVDPARAWRRWDAVAARRRDPAPRLGAERAARGRGGPLPSVLVVATPQAAADPDLGPSVSRQAYRRVDLMACGQGGGAPRSLAIALGRFLAGPWRLAVVVDAPGRLMPWAVNDLVAAVERHEDPAAVYADEESAAADGLEPVGLKPAWSPTRLAADPYAGPVVLFSRRAVRRCLAATGGPPRDTHDLLLRLARDPEARVAHVARPLFARGGPAAPRPRRTGTAAAAPPPDGSVPAEPVPVIVPTAYRGGRLTTLLDRLEPVADAVAVRIVDDGTHAAERAAALALCARRGLRAEAVTAPATPSFNYSQAVNAGARGVTGPLLLLNDDIEPPRDGAWLARLVGRLRDPGVGIVGAVLVYPEGPVQHMGVLVDGGEARHVGAGFRADWHGPAAVLEHPSEQAAVTAACMAVDGALFARLGGFDEGLAVEYGDVDFCLRAGVLGVRTVLEPAAVLVHHEKTSRGNAAHPADRERFAARWTAALAGGDPYYHPGLDTRLDWEPVRDQQGPVVRSRLGLIGPPAATAPPGPSARDGDPPAAPGSSRSTGR